MATLRPELPKLSSERDQSTSQRLQTSKKSPANHMEIDK